MSKKNKPTRIDLILADIKSIQNNNLILLKELNKVSILTSNIANSMVTLISILDKKGILSIKEFEERIASNNKTSELIKVISEEKTKNLQVNVVLLTRDIITDLDIKISDLNIDMIERSGLYSDDDLDRLFKKPLEVV